MGNIKEFAKWVTDNIVHDCTPEELIKRYEEDQKMSELDRKLAAYPGSVICPDCKGKGWDYGSDGCDIRSCYTCKGKGIVYSRKVTTTEFSAVE